MNRFQTAHTDRPFSRFQWVTSGDHRGPMPIFDDPVASDPHAVVVPSLGSIVPGWTLLVPRQQATNFATLRPKARGALNDLRQHVIGRLRSAFLGTVYEFEHGPAHLGGTLGCGVDQAHLHIVPLSLNLVEAIRGVPGNAISVPADLSDAWRLVPEGADYLYVRDTESNAAVIVLPTMLQSQAIRRIIADGLGLSEAWDYREKRGLNFALETRRVFSGIDDFMDHFPNE